MCKIISIDDDLILAKTALLNNLSTNNVVKIVNSKNIDFYSSLASILGNQAPMEENSCGNKTGNLLTEIKFPFNHESKSYSHSDTRQPFHTDGAYEHLSPQFCYLFCKESSKFGGSTIFIDNTKLVEVLSYYDSDLLHSLQTEKVIFTKGNDCKECYIIDDKLNLNWNWFRCNQKLKINLKFHSFLESKIFEGGEFYSVKLCPGEALFFNDSKVLHGRTSFIGNRWLIKGGIYV
jgi:alpha-ketoglutarate-dependent taurine dioxygenase